LKNYTVQDLNFSSVPHIQSILETLKVDNMTIPAVEFESHILEVISKEPYTDQKQQEIENQSPHILRFRWGHDHDFGSFKVAGLMGTRHIWMLSRILDHFGLQQTDLKGKRVLDIGCWTGGLSMILAKMGANVVAIDEVGAYSEIVAFQAKAFGLNNLEARQMNLFNLESSRIAGSFDIVFCMGFIYHISDPIIGLRNAWHCLKAGGSLYLDSKSLDTDQNICEYEGPKRWKGKFRATNWFVPSPKVIKQLLIDTGFEEIRVGNGIVEDEVTCDVDPIGGKRCFAAAKKLGAHTICKAGLSTRCE